MNWEAQSFERRLALTNYCVQEMYLVMFDGEVCFELGFNAMENNVILVS